ncbi:unnamed protein product [Fusarium fujikuroi]|nr:unnamed protein product [Fusarium fujikuroi]
MNYMSPGVADLSLASSKAQQLTPPNSQLPTPPRPIYTSIFVSIATDLAHGGQGSLFLSYTLYSVMVGLVSNCIAEIAVHLSERRNIGLNFFLYLSSFWCRSRNGP